MNSIVKVFAQSGLTQGVQFFEDPDKKFDFGLSAGDLADCLGVRVGTLLKYIDTEYISSTVGSNTVLSPENKPLDEVLPEGVSLSSLIIWEHGINQALIQVRSKVTKPFQDWLVKEVIPAIRKTGRYEDQSVLERLEETETRLALIEAENKKLSDIKEAIKEFHPNLDEIIRVNGQLYIRFHVYDPSKKAMIGDLTSEDLAVLKHNGGWGHYN